MVNGEWRIVNCEPWAASKLLFSLRLSPLARGRAVGDAERLHLAHPHDEGTFRGARLRRLEDAQALGDYGLELEGRAVEVLARLKRRDRAPAARRVRRLQLNAARGHVAVAVEAPVDVDRCDARGGAEVELDPVRLRALG